MKTFVSLKLAFTTLRSLSLSLGAAILIAGSLDSSAQVGPGFALQFDGVNDGVDMGAGKFAGVTNNFTMELWVNPTKGRTNTVQATSGFDGLANQSYAIFPELGSTAYGTAFHAGAGISVGTNGVSVVEHTSSYMPTPLVYVATITNWTHIAVVYSNKQPSLYINGILAATGLTSPKTFVHASAMLSDLGPTGTYGPYKGQIDEVRIWSSVRSQSEISANRSARLTGSESNLVAYYRLDEGTGTTTADASGNSRTGTLTNGVLWIGSTAPIGATPAVETTSANTLNTNATLNGLVTPNYLPTSTWFEWGTMANYYPQQTAATAIGNGTTAIAVSNVVSGLTPGLVYHYRVVASNAVGMARGKDVLFGSPAILLNGGTVLTNECHFPYADQATGFNAPLAIAAGSSESVILGADGKVVAWGNNSFGQTNVPANATNIVAIAAGVLHNLALRSDGTVVGWGWNDYNLSTPPPEATNVIALATGTANNLVLRKDGTIVAWGDNAAPYGLTNVPVSATNIVGIAVGNQHNVALRSDGTILAWGDNSQGQTNVPTIATNVVAVAAGYFHTLALRADGTLVSWGNFGQASIPVSASNIVAIAAHGNQSVALRNDGVVIVWGTSNVGLNTPPANATNVVAIAAGVNHILAVKKDGSIIGWGSLDQDATTVPPGVGTLIPNSSDTVNTNQTESYLVTVAVTNSIGGVITATRTVVVRDTIPPVITLNGNNPLTNIVNIPFDPGATSFDACGGSLAVTTNSRVIVGVPNTYKIIYTSADSFGNASTNTRTVVVVNTAVTLPPSSVNNGVATLNGSVNPSGYATTAWFEWGAGFNYDQQTPHVSLGNGSSILALSSTLSNLTGGVTYHYRVVASNAFGLTRGKKVLFGFPLLALNGGNFITNECHTPYNDPGVTASDPALGVAAGLGHSIIVRSDGILFGWGKASSGEITFPPSVRNPIAISASDSHTLALQPDGTVIAWGSNGNGESTVPVSASNVVAIAAGAAHNLVLRSDGTVVAWGSDTLGDVSGPNNADSAVAIAAGSAHSLVLKADGTIVGWGHNAYNQTIAPVSASNVVAMAAGGFHSMVLRADGTVIAWGWNDYGQTNVPANATNVVAIAAGERHSLALRSDGTVVAWGDTTYLQTPALSSATNVVAIAAGLHHSVALRSDGTVIAWGRNQYGQSTVPPDANAVNVNVIDTVATNYPNNYPVIYSATNSLGGSGSTGRAVVVKDTLAPVIIMAGNNPILITNQSNLPFIDPGASALDLCGGTYSVITTNNVNVNSPGTYTVGYFSTDSYGNTGTANRTVIVALPPSTPVIPGDQNGDGVVSQAELDTVYANFVTNSPWLKITNVAGLGGTNVSFSVTNSTLAGYLVEYSTNLATWLPLGSATPRFLFTDTNAPVNPQRYYRLRVP